jgi:hypothetical protein
MTSSRSVAFVGPTYAGLHRSGLIERAGFERLPPARRGDVDDLGAEQAGIIVLVDGRFNQALAVGHAEIRRALARGWQVWGLSSMGAIRAYEMRHLGMRGFGRVYEHFLDADDFQDDEVALVHASRPPYAPLSEPLVHIRYCLASMEHDGDISRGVAQAVVDELKAVWFAVRTLDAFVALLNRTAGATAAQCGASRVKEFDPFRVKTMDLVGFFEQRPWTNASYRAQPTPAPYHT